MIKEEKVGKNIFTGSKVHQDGLIQKETILALRQRFPIKPRPLY